MAIDTTLTTNKPTNKKHLEKRRLLTVLNYFTSETTVLIASTCGDKLAVVNRTVEKKIAQNRSLNRNNTRQVFSKYSSSLIKKKMVYRVFTTNTV